VPSSLQLSSMSRNGKEMVSGVGTNQPCFPPALLYSVGDVVNRDGTVGFSLDNQWDGNND
jgi:hypothetical protein